MSDRPDFSKMEEEILEFWRKEDIFRKTLEKSAPRGNFVFFEGPPTANGRPGIHHVEARAFKDLIPRYKTMRGYRVERKAGWDTHGLPVEIEVEKKLGISGKQQIESVKTTPRESIAYFNALCKESVWAYLDDWNKLTERIGFWLDLDRPYVTYYNEYIESLWWIVKQIDERGLLYKDYKVVPYCPRCGTALSSHELAQGYKDVEDISVVWKFPLRDDPQTFLLAWTTTPWSTLSTTGLSVNPEAVYVKVRVGNERIIFAKNRMDFVLADSVQHEVMEEMPGSKLVGLHYEPIAPSYKKLPEVQSNANVYQVFPADYVELTEGTGIVTINGSYGEIDMSAARKNGLPVVMDVDLQGKFTAVAGPYAGRFVHEVTPLLVGDFTKVGIIWRTDPYLHSYPHCWRCKIKLIYYAKDSWFVKMPALRDLLIKSNKTINWVPGHIREGRFGEWLREVKDWAFSRERYWGTPLPVWLCGGCDNKKVIGGFEEFPESASGNTYYILRHGFADSNKEAVVTADPDAPHHLTEEGKRQVEERARELARRGGVDVIVASPIVRTREAAEIVSAALRVPVQYDDRLREIGFGVLEGRPIPEYQGFWKREVDRFTTAPEDAENLTEVMRRMYACFKELDRQYHGKRVLIVSHGDPLWVLEAAFRGLSPQGILDFAATSYIQKGELRKLMYRQLPRNADGFADPHRPYVDDVLFSCEQCKGTMRRTPEVIDVWFDSGAMPFAQWHYPFGHKKKIDKGEAYPADYISEAIDQTRGWFYTLVAVATLLKKKAPFKNVICLGHIVDVEGKKMSKSVGNVIDPWDMVRKFGADAVRFFMYTTSQPGDTKRFDPKELDLIVKQTFMILWNVLAFWKLYAGSSAVCRPPSAARHVMDQWILSRLHEVTKIISERLDAYDVTPAARAITGFVDDLSTWYVRRSRDRFKNGEREPVAVLHVVLGTLAKLMAPFTPFIAESLHQALGGEGSVHLAEWPTSGKIDKKLLDEMAVVRNAVEIGHALRAEAGIRVRQPLGEVNIAGAKMREELLGVLIGELNVKKVQVVGQIAEQSGYAVRTDKGITVALLLEMSPELKREGWIREITRQVNVLRKERGLTPGDRITLFYETRNVELAQAISEHGEALKTGVLADAIETGRCGEGTEFVVDDREVRLTILKK